MLDVNIVPCEKCGSLPKQKKITILGKEYFCFECCQGEQIMYRPYDEALKAWKDRQWEVCHTNRAERKKHEEDAEEDPAYKEYDDMW